jgi:hypothetical protein
MALAKIEILLQNSTIQSGTGEQTQVDCVCVASIISGGRPFFTLSFETMRIATYITTVTTCIKMNCPYYSFIKKNYFKPRTGNGLAI